MESTEPIGVGQPAPDFTLMGPGGMPFTLSEFRGQKNVILVFFPAAFSPVCSHQLPQMQKDTGQFDAIDAVVIGVSVDNFHANQAFAERLGLSFPLLSDSRREVSAAYGVLNTARGTSGRALFVIDKQGRIAYRDVSANPGDIAQIPGSEGAIAALRGPDA